MANKRTEKMILRQIFRLYTSGKAKFYISKNLNLSRNTVDKYIRLFLETGFTYEEINQLNDQQLDELFSPIPPKPSKQNEILNALFPVMEKELGKVGITKLSLWNEYRKQYPSGLSYSRFTFLFNSWRKQSDPVMHIEHKAGEKMYIDYTGKKLSIVDKETGEIKEVEVFVAILGYSQLTYVEATNSQKKEDFIISVENALHYFGGVPQVIVPDNLKSAVTKSNKYEPTLNECFEDFAYHYGCTIIPARVRKPRDKSLVEGAVKIIYNRIFSTLKNINFFTLEELNNSVRKELEQHNDTAFKARQYGRRDMFNEVEKSTLLPLPKERYEPKEYAFATVFKTSHVYLSKDKHYYSVPYAYIGKKVKIIYSYTQVNIYYQFVLIASHKRLKSPYNYTTVKEHLPSSHQFVSEWNPDKFINWATDIGDYCRMLIIQIFERKQHPEQAYRSCLGILQMVRKIGKERLNRACKRAMEYEIYNYSIIKNILEKGLDLFDEHQNDTLQDIPEHDNIRGEKYYQ